ncbi:MAG: hypothetical protein WC554_06895 [Clostridia bacterium]
MTEYTDEQKDAMWDEIEKHYPKKDYYQEGDISISDIKERYKCGKETASKMMDELASKGLFIRLTVRRPGKTQAISVIRKIETQ